MNRNVVALVAGVGLLAGAGVAAAQEASIVEGKGYPVGEGTVLHPSVGAELGFTDNVFYEDAEQDASGILRLLVEAAIASKDTSEDAGDALVDADETADPAKPAIEFRAGGKLGYHEYLSSDDRVQAQRTVSADLSGHLVISPQGTFAFIADERFIRDTRPTNFESSDNTNRIANSVALGLRYQPGGRTINAGIRWENQLDVFEDSDQQFANRMINTFHLRSEWMFFPYTKAYADVSYGFVSGLGGDSDKRSASPLRGGVGIATALTEMLTVKLHAGWAYAGYSGGAGYNQPMLGAEVGYRYSPMGRVVAGYELVPNDSLNADFYRDHALTARVDQQFGRIVATAGGELRLRGYRGVAPPGPTSRDDLILAVGVRGQYVLKDWVAIVADYRTELDQTDYMSAVGDDPSFTRTEITAGVRAAF